MYTAQAPRWRAPPGRLCVRWRVSLTPSGTSGRRRLAEQHVFAITGADGRIGALDPALLGIRHPSRSRPLNASRGYHASSWSRNAAAGSRVPWRRPRPAPGGTLVRDAAAEDSTRVGTFG